MRYWLIIALSLPILASANSTTESLFTCLARPNTNEGQFLDCFGDFSEQCNSAGTHVLDYVSKTACFQSVVKKVLRKEAEMAEEAGANPEARGLSVRLLGLRKDIAIGEIECEYLDKLAGLGNRVREEGSKELSQASCRSSFYAVAYWRNFHQTARK